MRITIVTGFFLPVPPVQGGSTEKIWHRLAQEFAAAGHAVTFVSRAWPGFPARETVDGVTHIRLSGANHRRSLFMNLLLDVWWGLRVGWHLPPADVVVCNTVTLPVWLRWFKPKAGRVVAVLARMPKGHGRAYGQVDLLLSLSSAVTAKLRAENPRLAGKIAAFPYPIDWNLFSRAADRPTESRLLVIGFVGRIHPEKGLDLLLAAAAQLADKPGLPPWRLELIGPVDVAQGGGGLAYRDALLKRYAALGDRLAFLPPEFDPRKLAARYGHLDIFCYPSVAEQGETFGVAVAEAMAAGCSVVVSDLDCFRELVQEEVTGLVFDHLLTDRVERLSEALGRLLSDSSLRQSLADRGKEHVRQFDYGKSAQTVLGELMALVAK